MAPRFRQPVFIAQLCDLGQVTEPLWFCKVETINILPASRGCHEDALTQTRKVLRTEPGTWAYYMLVVIFLLRIFVT